MSALTFYDWLWIAFIIAAVSRAVVIAMNDRKESKRELKDAEDFENTINEIKHKDYGKEK